MQLPPHGWTGVQRSTQTNVRLGAVLCLIAGATNAGGFLAVGRYTSHMTGVLSSVADDAVLGHAHLVAAGIASLLAFVAGAMTTAVLVNWGLRRALHGAYGVPLLLESVALLVFGLFGAAISDYDSVFLPLTVALLCFIMGLQNAVITKISRAEIRTTHVTGLVTDMGIELGKLLYLNRSPGLPPVRANRERLRVQGLLIACFFIGGLIGAWGFKHWGYITTLPLALLLWIVAVPPVWQDLRTRWQATFPS